MARNFTNNGFEILGGNRFAGRLFVARDEDNRELVSEDSIVFESADNPALVSLAKQFFGKLEAAIEAGHEVNLRQVLMPLGPRSRMRLGERAHLSADPDRISSITVLLTGPDAEISTIQAPKSASVEGLIFTDQVEVTGTLAKLLLAHMCASTAKAASWSMRRREQTQTAHPIEESELPFR